MQTKPHLCFLIFSILVHLSQSSSLNPSPEGSADEEIIFPKWFLPFFWTFLAVISVLGVLTQVGQAEAASQKSTYRSILTLIFIDTLSYVNIALSAILVSVVTYYSKPWQSITVIFAAPLAALIASIIFGFSTQSNERILLTLWLRSATLTSFDRVHIDTNCLEAALQLYQHLDDTIITEDNIFALMRTNRPGGIPAAAKNKGSSKPFVNFVHTWLRSGDPLNVPKALVRLRIRGYKKPRFLSRQISAKQALKQLETSGCKYLRQYGTHVFHKEHVLIASAMDGCVMNTPCKAFGKIWLRAARHPGIPRRSEGWWYVGGDIIQSLKCCLGIEFLSAQGRFDNANEHWTWIEKLGFGWRKEHQLTQVAGELGHAARQDENRVIAKALSLASSGTDIVASDIEYRLAVEANAVSALGLAVNFLINQLHDRLDEICKGVVDILRTAGAKEVNDVWMLREPWPEEAVAHLLFEWVGRAAVRAGRPGGPGIDNMPDTR